LNENHKEMSKLTDLWSHVDTCDLEECLRPYAMCNIYILYYVYWWSLEKKKYSMFNKQPDKGDQFIDAKSYVFSFTDCHEVI
jgi:hypothetical protein